MRSTALQILALWTLAIVQPALDLLGRSPEFFVAHGATRSDVWLLLAAFMLLPPLALVAASGWHHSPAHARPGGLFL